jgi:hypothetical protein
LRARQRSDEDEPTRARRVELVKGDLETDDDARETGKFCYGPLLAGLSGEGWMRDHPTCSLSLSQFCTPLPQPAPKWPELAPVSGAPDWPAARQGCKGRGAQKKEPTGHGCVGGRRKQFPLEGSLQQKLGAADGQRTMPQHVALQRDKGASSKHAKPPVQQRCTS